MTTPTTHAPARELISHARLLEVLDYDRSTGIFRWKAPGDANKVAGKIAGCSGTAGRIIITIDKRSYLAHRLAWFYVTGEWPARGLDHRSVVASDNRFGNLREATGKQNSRNQKPKKSRSGLKGAAWDASRGKWIATIRTDAGRKTLGRFDTAEEAHAAYKQAAKEFHGEFARHE